MFLYDFSRFLVLKPKFNRIFTDCLCLVDKGEPARLSAAVALVRSRPELADSAPGCRLVDDVLAMAPLRVGPACCRRTRLPGDEDTCGSRNPHRLGTTGKGTPLFAAMAQNG